MSTTPNSTDINLYMDSLRRMTEALEQSFPTVKEKTQEIEKQIKNLEAVLRDQTQTSRETSENVRVIQTEMKSILASVRIEVERMNTFNENLHSLFTERIDGLKKDVDGLIDRDIPTLARKSDLSQVNNQLEKVEEKINKLPGIQEITRELAHNDSPLCTKDNLSDIAVQVAEIKGKLSINFWVTVTTVVSVLGGILLIYMRLPSPQPATHSPAPPTQNP